MPGRPTKLTSELQERIVQVIRLGHFRDSAAEYAGIDPGTLSRWFRLGERTKAGRYAEFRLAVLKAEREGEIRAIDIVMKAAAEDARHAEWWLERKHADHWGRSEKRTVEQTVRHEGAGGFNLTVEWLGGVLAPYPEAKAAVGAAIAAMIEQRKAKQLEAK